MTVPSSDDKLIQQAIKMLLESIYEDTFAETSHGFRPDRSCHTPLSQIKINFTGVKWFVEGDIFSFFDNIDHHILISILRRRIKDEYFISLIWKFLRAGYVENGIHFKPNKGLHQGSLISPILANVYLNELDQHMAEFKNAFDRNEKRKRSPEYNRIQNREQRLRKTISKLPDSSKEKANMIRGLKQLRNIRVSMSCSDPMDSSYKRIFYQRYADDFIIGIIGNKQDAEQAKDEVRGFLSEQLQLELSQEKTLITHGKDKAQFLGYGITIGRKGTPSKDKLGKLSDKHNGKVKLYLPQDAWLKKLKLYKVLKISNRTGMSETWEPSSEKNRVQNSLTVSNIMLSSAVSDTFGKSSSAILSHLLKHPDDKDFDFLPLLHGSMLKKQADIALVIDGTISNVQAGKITLCLSHMDDLKRYIAQLEATAMRLAASYAGAITIIQSVPGISQLSALAIFSEIGAEMSSFHSDKHLCSWAGVAPSNDQSAGKKKSVRISRAGVYIKPLLVQCANTAIKDNTSHTIAHAMNRLSTVAATREPLSPLLKHVNSNLSHAFNG